ncbi:hypothetical protein FRC16_005500 [Serendipita sp. 398]|nr:hypothetical protein FRC16_005500 [Serendipita sp. 398]
MTTPQITADALITEMGNSSDEITRTQASGFRQETWRTVLRIARSGPTASTEPSERDPNVVCGRREGESYQAHFDIRS